MFFTPRKAALELSLLCCLSLFSPVLAQAQEEFIWGPRHGYGTVPPLPIPMYRDARRHQRAPVVHDEYERFDRRGRQLGPAEVRAIIGEQGMRLTGALTRNGRVFVADVRDRAGAMRRLIIDGNYGRVLQIFPGAVTRVPPPLGRERFAARPVNPDVDTDALGPDIPAVIPGVGPRRSADPADRVRPGQSNQKTKKPVKKTAARPADARPAAARPEPAIIPAPAAVNSPALEPQLPISTGLPPAQVAPAPAAALPVSPPAAAPEPASPATPQSRAAPATGTPPAAQPPAPRMTEPAQPAERPRRRVRFLKPETNSATTGTGANTSNLVPIPEPPPLSLPQAVIQGKPAIPAAALE